VQIILTILLIILGIVIGIPLLIYALGLFLEDAEIFFVTRYTWIVLKARAMVAGLFFLLANWLWWTAIPFSTFQFWTLRGSAGDILGTGWPIFVWVGLAFLSISFIAQRFMLPAIQRYLPDDIILTMGHPIEGIWQSLWVGIGEEIILRWIVFYDIIVLLQWANFLLGGFAGGGLLAWIYLHIIGPIANFVTFGSLSSILFHPAGWAVGAAIMIVTRLRFKRRFFPANGGISDFFYWITGLFLFLIMFKYGLIASILAHCVQELFLVVLVLTVGRWVKPDENTPVEIIQE
jgi:hypothetical protein